MALYVDAGLETSPDVSWNIGGVPISPPGPPAGVVAAAGDGEASVSWTAPADDGGGPVNSYLVTASPGGALTKVGGASSSAIVAGLTDGTPYTFTVTASNSAGPGQGSDPSGAVTPQSNAPAPVTVSQTVPDSGGTVTTDPAAAGTSPQVPMTTAVTTTAGGEVTVAESAVSGPPPTGFALLGEQVVITAPNGTADAPLQLVFTLDPSQLAGADPATVVIFRTENGGSAAAVPACTGAPGTAGPDPCVAATSVLAGGAVQFTILTSTASLWNLAVPAVTEPVVTIDSVSKTLLGRADPSTSVTWHADENGAYSVRVGGSDCSSGTRVASGAYTGAPGKHSTTIASSALSEGPDTIRVCVTDSASRTNSATVVVTKDTTAPIVTIDGVSPSPLHPADASTVATWHANENGGYRVFINASDCSGKSPAASGTYTGAPAPLATTLSAALLKSGANTIRVCVTDAAANTGSQSVSVTRNTARSTATSVSCLPNPALPGHAATCTATVGDTDGGTPSTPTGTVTWKIAAGSGSLSATSCKLSSGSCQVKYTPAASQQTTQSLAVSYGGDPSHAASSSSGALTLLVAGADHYATAQSTALTVAAPGVLANDLPAGGITAKLVSGPSNGTLTLSANGSFGYTPKHGFLGSDTFSYSAVYTASGLVSSPTTVTVAVLGSGVKCANCDLAGLNLAGFNLASSNLAGANLAGANLTGTVLSHANLTGANFAGATSAGATVTGATWSNTTCPDGTNSNSHAHTCVGHGF